MSLERIHDMLKEAEVPWSCLRLWRWNKRLVASLAAVAGFKINERRKPLMFL